MESPAMDYLDSPMDGDDVTYHCKGCDMILEEGKAFELAGNRWHIECFRCNTCGTLLDSDANLLLLGDGSLICNNCTYSCSACGNKIEDLAILTGDQAFCATCFRCRNCKRKIENLRYARTSQGIFCMSCHESLMARRRKKSRAAAAQTKVKEKDQSPMLMDKSLPALPPNAIPQRAFSPDKDSPGFLDIDTPTELSPRPHPPYTQNSSRSSSKRDCSPDRSREGALKDGLTLPSSTYKKNRHSTVSNASDVNGDAGDFFVPLALDPSPAAGPASSTPRSLAEAWNEASKSSENKENKDYFAPSKTSSRGSNKERITKNKIWDQDATPHVAGPHIAYQEKERQPSSDLATSTASTEIQRKALSTSRDTSAHDDSSLQHANGMSKNVNGRTQPSNDKFRLQEAPKSKKSGASRSDSYSETAPVADASLGGAASSATNGSSMSSQDSRAGSRQFIDSVTSQPPTSGDSPGISKIARKEVPKIPSSLGNDASSSSQSPSFPDDSGTTLLGKPISGPYSQSSIVDESAPPSRSSGKLPPAQAKNVRSPFTVPRAPPPPPPSNHQRPNDESATPASNGKNVSPKLLRWSAGGDFTMDEDMARILGTDESSQSILRRVSNAVRHGRSNSEQSVHQRHGRSASETTRTTTSPRWPNTPIAEDGNDEGEKDISGPIDMHSHPSGGDPALLRRQLKNSEQRVSELERRIDHDKDLKNLNQKLIEKRKTVSVLDSQAEIMIRQLEVLAGYVEKAKDTKQPLNLADLEESAIKEFVQKLDKLKSSIAMSIEQLYEERDGLVEEKARAIADRDRALVEFEQLSNKNAQLADMNNDLTHQIQERFKAQSGHNLESPKQSVNGLGLYTHHHNDKSSTSINIDDSSNASHRPSTSTTLYSSLNTYPQSMDQDSSMEPATVLSAPHVINIRKGQARKFNWKKGGQQVAKGVSKGLKGAFASVGEKQPPQYPGQLGDNIGVPYTMNKDPTDFPATPSSSSLPRSTSLDPSRQGSGGFALFKKTATMPKTHSNGSFTGTSAEPSSTLFGSDLIERTEYEHRQIPSVVTRCIEEVELRGMDIEGIYRKTGGSGQVKIIQEGFDKTEEFDISDPDLDITAVTSVLKQYFRKLPTPLLTFDVYDRVLESTSIEDDQERCNHLRLTFNSLPPKHRDCLEFLIFHLERVAARQKENLMTPKNLAVVFAPTIMRDHSLEREMTDMHAKNNAVQFIIENSQEIFGGP